MVLARSAPFPVMFLRRRADSRWISRWRIILSSASSVVPLRAARLFARDCSHSFLRLGAFLIAFSHSFCARSRRAWASSREISRASVISSASIWRWIFLWLIFRHLFHFTTLVQSLRSSISLWMVGDHWTDPIFSFRKVASTFLRMRRQSKAISSYRGIMSSNGAPSSTMRHSLSTLEKTF